MKRKKIDATKTTPKLQESYIELNSIRKEMSEYVKKVAKVESNNNSLKLKNETLNKKNSELKLEIKSLTEKLDVIKQENDSKLRIAKEQWAKRAVHYAKEYKKNIRERGTGVEPPVESVIKDCVIS